MRNPKDPVVILFSIWPSETHSQGYWHCFTNLIAFPLQEVFHGQTQADYMKLFSETQMT